MDNTRTPSVSYLDMSLAIGRKEGRKDRCQRRQGQKGGEKVEKESTKTVEDLIFQYCYEKKA